MLNELAIVICSSFVLLVLFMFTKAVGLVLLTGFKEIFSEPAQEVDKPMKKETRGRPRQYIKLVHPEDLDRYYEKRGKRK